MDIPAFASEPASGEQFTLMSNQTECGKTKMKTQIRLCSILLKGKLTRPTSMLNSAFAVTLLFLATTGCNMLNLNRAETTGNSNTASSREKIGVQECDDFLAKFDACVSSKVPEAERAKYNIDSWVKSWKKQAGDPSTKGRLATLCKQSADNQATLKSYGCTF